MNFFKLYIGDYQRDTAHLSLTEHGAYLLMLQHYYATEKPLPVGKALHRMLRATDKAERDAIDTIASQFWRETDGGLVNDRADAEITKAGAQAETNRHIALAREARRKAAREEHEASTNRATNAEPNHSHSHSHSVSEIPRVGAAKPRPARKAPPDFLVTADLQQWAREHVPGLDIRAETEKFRDHTFRTAISDWPGAWRNWMRRGAEGARPNGSHAAVADIFAGAK